MALDAMAKELVDETMKALNEAPFTHDAVIRISPRRMRALQLFVQQKLQVQMNGKVLTLQVDDDAPELAAEISEILGFDDASKDAKADISNDEELAEFLAWKKAKAQVT